MDALDNDYRLHEGDRLTFRVLEDQEEARPLTITDAGQLDVPELGLVQAAGKTCKQLAYEVKTKLEQTKYFRATVIVAIGNFGRRVYVDGEVQRPGMQEIPGGGKWTVARAIMRAGGFKLYADKKNVQVTRASQAGKPLTVNVDEVLAKGRADKDLALEAEDMIFVPTLTFKWK